VLVVALSIRSEKLRLLQRFELRLQLLGLVWHRLPGRVGRGRRVGQNVAVRPQL
jgi:hypothetical protein